MTREIPAVDLVDGDTVWIGEEAIVLDTVELNDDGRVDGVGIDGERLDWDADELVEVESDDDED